MKIKLKAPTQAQLDSDLTNAQCKDVAWSALKLSWLIIFSSVQARHEEKSAKLNKPNLIFPSFFLLSSLSLASGWKYK